MHCRNCLLVVFLFGFCGAQAQYFKISGKITNDKLEPLALVSIQVKGSVKGTISKEDGSYELRLEEGIYDLAFSMVGYKSLLINVVVSRDYVQNIVLETDEGKNLSEVIVRGKMKDRSEEILRNVIKHKDDILAAAGPYSCNVYIRATQEDSTQRNVKTKKKAIDTITANLNADLQRMAMAEISLHYDHENDSRVKEERTGVVKRGNPEALFYLSLTEGNFNLYNNLLTSTVLSEVPFLSPVSYSGFAAYRYKVINIKHEDGRKIYTISVKPRQLSNVTVEGEIKILDSAWVILSAHFTLPNYHIPEYDHFEIDQQYNLVDNKAWMITRQQFNYYSRTGKGKLSGETIASYKDFEFNKEFPKKYFGTELSSTAQEAYERDSSFWQKTRTEPLTAKEIRFIHYKDSLFRVTTSQPYFDSIDRITNKVTWPKLLLFGQTKFNREKKRSWQLPPVSDVIDPFRFGGLRIKANVAYFKTFTSKKSVQVFSNISYGIRNHDVNGNISITHKYNPFNGAFINVSAQREFQYIFQGDAWINMLKRDNFYLNQGIGINHGVEVANGLSLFVNADYSYRRSVVDYETNPKLDTVLGFVNEPVSFESYNAFYGKVRLQYTPFQRFIREPREKIILGSKWPTFYASWRKGIPGVLKSVVDFDYLEFGMEQELKLGVTGVFKYKILTGNFFNTKDLRMVDYKFQRRGDPILFMNPNEAFQSLDSTFPVFKRFYQAHFVHEFNGALLNKIPLFKKLELREIVGGGFLIAHERNLHYAELFTGIEKVLKIPFYPIYKFKLGAYVIGSAANQFHNPVQFKVGFTVWDRSSNKWR
ncbi:MAG: carboxypeptidase-like regulatory domain-containing protein [Bacteroidetes bacterium]|nr:MAG: carboxypeptidase-like regulatory domain-containing protein [Bacteroidota bacterium]